VQAARLRAQQALEVTTVAPSLFLFLSLPLSFICLSTDKT